MSEVRTGVYVTRIASAWGKTRQAIFEQLFSGVNNSDDYARQMILGIGHFGQFADKRETVIGEIETFLEDKDTISPDGMQSGFRAALKNVYGQDVMVRSAQNMHMDSRELRERECMYWVVTDTFVHLVSAEFIDY